MSNYFYHLRIVFWRFTLAVILLFLSRVFFFINNYETFHTIGFFELLKICFYGVRFDVFVIVFIMGAVFILMVLPGNLFKIRWYQMLCKILFVVTSSVLVLANLADSEYFKFTRKRSSAYIFDIMGFNNMEADATRQLPQFVLDFWYIFIFWIILTLATWWVYPKLNNKKIKVNPLTLRDFFIQTFVFSILIGLGIIGARGGTQLKPLRIINATNYTSTQNAPLVLNTPFTILKTIGKSKLRERNYFNDNEIGTVYNPEIRFANDSCPFKKMNVIVIILESFGNEYIGSLNLTQKGYTPFLDSLISKSLCFNKAYANGTQSIEALPSIIASLPSLMDNPFIPSYYSTDEINSFASILKNEGYNSSLYHGLTNGSMGFDNFAQLAKFDKYYGRAEYANEKDYDGTWGIFDEEFLQFTASKLNETKQPFFSCVMTLSSHHPYTVPEKYKQIFTKGELPIHKVIAYSDFALKRFFDTVSKMDWYKNTIFVLTADHTGPAISDYFKTDIGRFAVPIIYYSPADTTLIGIDKGTITQQTDILPSVLDYLCYNKPFISFGKSVFSKDKSTFAINYLSGVYQLIENDFVLLYNGYESIGLYNFRTDTYLKQNLLSKDEIMQKKMERKIKAIIQQYNNRLIKDQLVIKQ